MKKFNSFKAIEDFKLLRGKMGNVKEGAIIPDYLLKYYDFANWLADEIQYYDKGLVKRHEKMHRINLYLSNSD